MNISTLLQASPWLYDDSMCLAIETHRAGQRDDPSEGPNRLLLWQTIDNQAMLLNLHQEVTTDHASASCQALILRFKLVDTCVIVY